MIVASVGSGGAARNGGGDYHSLVLYKERREMTHSPLGPNALVGQSGFEFTRGFKSPEAEIFQMPLWFFVFVKRHLSFRQELHINWAMTTCGMFHMIELCVNFNVRG